MDPLAQLHDIQLPPAISWWPIAYGWYLLILFFVILGYGVWRYCRRKAQTKAIRAALQLLAEANMADISTLLRRVALTRHAKKEVAALQGEAWLAFLDRTGSTSEFTQGKGRVLITGPYQVTLPEVDDELRKLVREWMHQQDNR